MKLCFIGEFPLPNSSPEAGPQNVLYNLVKGIEKYDKEIDITIVTIHDGVEKPFVEQYFSKVNVQYLPSLKIIPRSIGDPILVKKFLQNNHFDIVHAHYPNALSNIMNMNMPKVLTLHGILHLEKKFEKNPIVKLLYYDYNYWLLKRIFPKLDGFVAIGPYAREEIIKINGADNLNIVYQINNPIDRSFFSITINEKKQYAGNCIIFYPARITERKNQLAAIEVLSKVKQTIPNIKLILTGDCDKTYLNKVNSLIEKKKLNNNVEYLGVVSRDRILELYKKASIVYLLSNQETQPMSILEAMSTGTPVIASDIKSISCIVENGFTGYLVDPKNSDKIAEYTIELLNDKNKRLKMAEHAKKVACQNYYPDITSKQTLKMYKDMVGKNVSK